MTRFSKVTVAQTLAVLLVLGVWALIASLTSDLSLGLIAVGVSAILLFGFVPAARKYCSGEAEQRVVARNGPAFCLMLALVWIVPGLLGYFDVVPQGTVFMLAFAAFLLVGMPVLGWHHGCVQEARRELEREAGVAPTAPGGPAGTNAAEPKPAAPAKSLVVSLLVYWWSLIPGATVGVLLLLSSGKLERAQLLQITNTGSQSVDLRNASASWGDNRVLTLHPGMSGFWMFRDGDQFRITRSEQEPPKPGTTPSNDPLPPRSESLRTALTQNPDGSAAIVIKHAARTAEVRINEDGKIEFEFTDL